MKYSVVIPAKNEEESVKPLYEAIAPVMSKLSGEWELIIVDDGSTDQTVAAITELRNRDPHVKLVRFRRSFGQTAAWSAGFDYSRGEYVIVMDADLQNDPQDIPDMLAKMDHEDLDVISGWRKNRRDA